MTVYELIYAEDASCVGGVGVLRAQKINMESVYIDRNGRLWLRGAYTVELKLPKFLVLDGASGCPAEVSS